MAPPLRAENLDWDPGPSSGSLPSPAAMALHAATFSPFAALPHPWRHLWDSQVEALQVSPPGKPLAAPHWAWGSCPHTPRLSGELMDWTVPDGSLSGRKELLIGGVTSAEDGGAGDSQPGCEDVVVNSPGSPFAGSWGCASRITWHAHTHTHMHKPGSALSQSCERTEGRRRDGVDRTGPFLRLAHPRTPGRGQVKPPRAKDGACWQRGAVHTPPLSDASAPWAAWSPWCQRGGLWLRREKGQKAVPWYGATGPGITTFQDTPLSVKFKQKTVHSVEVTLILDANTHRQRRMRTESFACFHSEFIRGTIYKVEQPDKLLCIRFCFHSNMGQPTEHRLLEINLF